MCLFSVLQLQVLFCLYVFRCQYTVQSTAWKRPVIYSLITHEAANTNIYTNIRKEMRCVERKILLTQPNPTQYTSFITCRYFSGFCTGTNIRHCLIAESQGCEQLTHVSYAAVRYQESSLRSVDRESHVLYRCATTPH